MSTIITRYKNAALAGSAFVVFLNILVLVIYYCDLQVVIDFFPSQQLSNPVTALCLILCGLSILCWHAPKKIYQQVGRGLSFVVFIIAVIKCGEFVFKYSSFVDKWLYTNKLAAYGKFGKPNFIAPNTAFCFLVIAFSLLIARNTKRRNTPEEYLASIVNLIAFISIVGYLYDSIELYHVKSFMPMAFSTALSFFLLSSGVLLYKSETGLLSFLTRKYDGSKMARFLIPFVFAVPLFTGLLKLYEDEAGLNSTSFGAAIFTCCNVVIFVLLNRYCSIFLNKSNKALIAEMEARKDLEDQLRLLNKDLEKKVIERTGQKTALEKKLMYERLNQQQKIMQATIEGQEKEKKQIGMELHDNINQILASTQLYLNIAATDNNLTQQMLEKARGQVISAIKEIRNLSKSLVPYGIETGDISEAISDMTTTIEMSSGIKFNCNFSKTALPKLDSHQRIAVYRIIQEQLNNIIKHAKAQEVSIVLREVNNYIQLAISDDGIGFDVNSKKTGIGLSNMKSRTELLGGIIQIESAKGQGCKLSVRFPAQALLQNDESLLKKSA